MSFLQHEICYTGNSLESAPSRGFIRWYDANTGLVEIANISGQMFAAGDLVFGQDSGASHRLLSFSNNIATLANVSPWDTTDMIVQDDGALIAVDAHFNNTTSQDYQQRNIITK